MQQHKDVTGPWPLDAWGQRKMFQRRRRLPWSIAIIVLVLTTLACAFIGSDRSASQRVVMLTRLPTFTRTPLPTLRAAATAIPVAVAIPAQSVGATPTPALLLIDSVVSPAVVASDLTSSPADPLTPALAETFPANPTSPPATSPLTVATEISPSASPPVPPPVETSSPAHTPTATATEAPPTPTPAATATEAPTPTHTPTPATMPLPEKWVFTGVRAFPDQEEGNLVLYGNLINNTGAPQEMDVISGLFYDAQGQIIASDRDLEGAWPIEVVPPAGQMPFELVVNGIQNAANFDLNVESTPVEDTCRQDFEFLNLNQTSDGGIYCLNGQLRNSEGELGDYLIVVAVLYDSEDKVIGYNDYYELSPNAVKGDETLAFNLCIDTLDLPVARYDLQAWGR